jgi:hypothetical protein
VSFAPVAYNALGSTYLMLNDYTCVVEDFFITLLGKCCAVHPWLKAMRHRLNEPARQQPMIRRQPAGGGL